ncbi:hypothetical protein CIP101434_02054 [Corynebacterium diphtheriae]|nr:hypothetical protein CIP101280_01744 [Corynebacterium diphtheriae]CAB0525594.1 hypothetical protein CIP101434_02054 [Corynebacterium diphtheriae]CAB0542733.1 hypothetical protein CIP107517_00670 [Corynebacterium diphtheriae]
MAKDATGNGPFRPVTAGKAHLHYPRQQGKAPARDRHRTPGQPPTPLPRVIERS